MATAVNYGAITLADVALTTKDEVLESFVKNLIRTSPAMGTVPWVTKNVLSMINKKWKSLPPLQQRLLNEGYALKTKGTTEDESWEPAIQGGDIQIDKQLQGLENVFEDEATLQTSMHVAGYAADWTSEMFNGDRAVNAKTFVGLKRIVAAWQNSRQTIDVGPSTDSLDVTLSATNEQILNNAMQSALEYVGSSKTPNVPMDAKGGKIIIYCNQRMKLGLGVAFRAAGLLDTTKDQFDRTFQTYMGYPIVDVGLASDQTTEIITNTEEPGDGGADATSIYVVRWDPQDGLIGVQKQAMNVYDPLGGREMESMPGHLLRVDWATMLIPRSDFCVARISNIRNPAAWTIPVP